MQFNSHTTGQDLNSDISFQTSTSLTDFPIADRTRSANIWYHKAALIIQSVDGTWKWDDSNNTTSPEGLTNLVSGQKDYTLDDAMLEVERVEVKDSNGNWYKLRPVDQTQIIVAMDEYKTTDGIPNEYDKEGSSLMLYPSSNYNLDDGLKVYFKRHANIFTTTDTTKEPGFAAAFHSYISTGVSLDYCDIFKQDRVLVLTRKLLDLEKRMKDFYGRRDRDTRRIIRSLPPKAI